MTHAAPRRAWTPRIACLGLIAASFLVASCGVPTDDDVESDTLGVVAKGRIGVGNVSLTSSYDYLWLKSKTIAGSRHQCLYANTITKAGADVPSQAEIRNAFEKAEPVHSHYIPSTRYAMAVENGDLNAEILELIADMGSYSIFMQQCQKAITGSGIHSHITRIAGRLHKGAGVVAVALICAGGTALAQRATVGWLIADNEKNREEASNIVASVIKNELETTAKGFPLSLKSLGSQGALNVLKLRAANFRPRGPEECPKHP